MNIVTTPQQITHPKFGKIIVSNHVRERLYTRKNIMIDKLHTIIGGFKWQNGTKRCEHLRVIDQKIQKWTYPDSDYIYSKYHNMALVVDRYTKVAITVLDLNTDYYTPQY
jgi:hypothetical protein